MNEELIKKKVRHVFTPDERAGLSNDLCGALAAKDTAESEFDSIKATYKARVVEAESKVGSIAATLRAGWELREKLCGCTMVPEKRQKFFWLADDPEKAPVIWTDMDAADWQRELLQAESKFDPKSELVLWDAAPDRGVLVVGQFEKHWYSALRLNVGSHALEERLDSEQTSVTDRFVAIERAQARAMQWIKANLKDAAKGFEAPIKAIVEAEKGKVE